MENELVKEQQQQQQHAAPYRNQPYGSSELEGMYSPGEGTPSKHPVSRGVAPPSGQGQGGSGRGQKPPGSGRGYPPPGRGRGTPYMSQGRGQPRGHPTQQRSTQR